MTYSWKQGIIKAIKYGIVFLLSTIIAGLPVNITQITIGALLVWLLNFLKVKWGIRIP